MLTIKDHTELELGTENEREPTVSSSIQVPEPNSHHSELIASSDAGSRGKTWVMRLLWQKLLPAELSHCSKRLHLVQTKLVVIGLLHLRQIKKVLIGPHQ